MFGSPVKQDLSQSPKGARRPAAKLSIVFYSYSPEGVTCLAQPTPYRLKIANFSTPCHFAPSFGVTPFEYYGKSLRILKLKTSGSQRWRFGNPSLHRFWLIHMCAGRTDRPTDRMAMAKTRYSSSCCCA